MSKGQWPRGYTVWSDHVDGESPQELHNRLMAELIDTIEELTNTIKEITNE